MLRVLNEAQKAVNRESAKAWRIRAKENGREYLDAAKLYSRVSSKLKILLQNIHCK